MESNLHHTWVIDEERPHDRFVKKHWATMTYEQMAQVLDISDGAINHIVRRLKRRGELPDRHKNNQQG